MTNLDEATTAPRCAPTRSDLRKCDLGVVIIATISAIGAWGLWTATGDGAVTVRSGDGVREVGAVSVGVTAAMVSVAGALLLRLLVAKLRDGLRWWTILACTVLLVSMLGPLGASNLPDGLTLLSMHTLVGVTVLVGLRRTHRAC